MPLAVRRHPGNLLFLCLTAVALVGGLVTFAAPDASAVSSGCRTVVRTLTLQEGAVPLKIGSQHLTFRACWNTKGIVTSSSVVQDTDATGVGGNLGWKIDGYAPVSTNETGATVIVWHAKGHAQYCPGKVMCSPVAKWDTVVRFYSPGFVGPLPRNQQGTTFRAVCTSRPCNLRFGNQIY